MTPLTKTCSKCGFEKELNAFSPNKGGKYGRKSICKPCQADARTARYSQDKAAAAAAAREYRMANPDKNRAAVKRYRLKNLDKLREYNRRYFKANPEKVAAWRAAQYQKFREDRLARASLWQKANPDKVRARTARRRAAALKATPPWADRAAIIEVYIQAARLTLETGIPHDVDHIIPLKGKHVCGLHVPWNLRAVPASENRSKGNKFDPT